MSFDELAAKLRDIAEIDVGWGEQVLISYVPLKRLEFGEGYGAKWTRESDGHRRWAGPRGDVDSALAPFLLGVFDVCDGNSPAREGTHAKGTLVGEDKVRDPVPEVVSFFSSVPASPCLF